MKFWQKLYLAVLALFLMVFAFCMLVLVQSLYENNLKTEKTQGCQAAYWLSEKLSEDFSTLEKETISEEDASKLMSSYTYDFVLRSAQFSLYHEEELLYTNMNFEDRTLVPQGNVEAAQARVYWLEEDCYYCICMPIEGYSEYTLLYFHEIVGLHSFMSELTKLCLIIGIAGTILLATLLYFLVKKMTKPLGRLENAAEKIASGQYDTRIEVRGEDEFSSVAESFNGMAGDVQRHVKSLEEENQSKQLFIDNLAHEMNTPLTSIRGYGEHLQRSGDLLTEEERFEALSFIVKEAGRLSGMGKQLMLLANLREGEFSFEDVSIRELFELLEKMFAGRSREAGVNVIFSHEVETVRGDFTLLESLIANLIENGIRACERGGSVEVSAAQGQSTWILRVKDNGRGISKEALPHLAEPFYRTDKARSRANGGAGLGLTLCRQIVDVHHGTMEILSEVGEGTEFVIIFTTL